MENNGTKDVTTNEIMKFLKEHMVMKEEFYSEIAAIHKEMTTKASKEDLGRLRSDLIDFSDKKFFALTDILSKKGVVTPRDVQAVFGIDPSPQSA